VNPSGNLDILLFDAIATLQLAHPIGAKECSVAFAMEVIFEMSA
jgi:hypothetical protein